MTNNTIRMIPFYEKRRIHSIIWQIMIICFGSLFFLSCKNAPSHTAEPAVPPAKPKMQVFFFTVSSNELAAMEEKGDDISGLMSSLDDFEKYAQMFMDSSGMIGLQSRLTDVSVIVLKMNNGEMFTFDRTGSNPPFGVLLFDGVQPPKVLTGIYHDFELRDMAKNYFSSDRNR